MKPGPKKAAAVKKPAAREAPAERIPMKGDTLELHLKEFPRRMQLLVLAALGRVTNLDLQDGPSRVTAQSAIFSASRYLELVGTLVMTDGVKRSKTMYANRLEDLHRFLSYSHNDALRDAYKTETNKAEAKRKKKTYDDAEEVRYATQAGVTLAEYRKRQKAYWVKHKADWDAREAAQLAAKQAAEAAEAKKLSTVEARRVARQKPKPRAAASV